MEKPCKTMEKMKIDLKIKDLLENLLTKTLMAFQFCQKGFQPDQKKWGRPQNISLVFGSREIRKELATHVEIPQWIRDVKTYAISLDILPTT